MLVFNNPNIAYRPICKCGTNTMYDALSKLFYNAAELEGLPPTDVRNKLDEDFGIKRPIQKIDLTKYFVFAIIRNPWSRLVSAHKELLRMHPWGNTTIDPKWLNCLPFKETYNLMSGSFEFTDFVDYVINIEPNEKRDGLKSSPYWIKQAEVLDITHINYNLLAKIETIDDYTSRMQQEGNIKLPKKLSKLHASEPYEYKSYYTTKMVDLVGQHYEDDVRLGDYEF
tara:strand:- start:1092 stop:1769 length:678 start_codon:yes stop_codon:yes gene_type:complete